MSRWMLAATLSVLALPAQPIVTVNSISESLSGTTLIGASDSAYLTAVRALIGDSALPPYEPALPFSVVVRTIPLISLFSVMESRTVEWAMCPDDILPVR